MIFTANRQTTSRILMVRPASFGFNPETASSNAFQKDDQAADKQEISEKAIKEFDQMVESLRDHHVDVTVIQDSKEPEKPDAVFPNNWISTQTGGTIYTYPMESPARRLEYRPNILDELGERFSVNAVFDFSDKADDEIFLEGTGSMILDRVNKIVYACTSPRTHEKLLLQWAKVSGYKPIIFQATDEKGQAIYHTNVLMGLGTNYVVICLEAIKNPSQRRQLVESFRNTEMDIVEISLDQMMGFAGNVLEVENKFGDLYLLLSQSAFEELRDDQKKIIERYAKLLPFNIPTIEKYGGGSVRCMVAELFLEPR
ncbi:MAG: amidinotransferase [Saprospiraceae bacterium]|nr:amidinotransferase [Saprospiraceae bacterium]